MRKIVFVCSIAMFLLITLMTTVRETTTAQTIPATEQTIPAANSSATELIMAGDVANGDNNNDLETGKILTDHPSATIFVLGDSAYPSATLKQLNQLFGPTWGAHLHRMWGVIGNHEKYDPNCPENGGTICGFFEYFGDRAGPQPQNGYYSVDVGNAHIVIVNSNCGIGCKIGSDQYKWFIADLQANSKTCTFVMSHEPPFSDGQNGDNIGDLIDLWNAAIEYGVDTWISGHDHDYQRFPKLLANGTIASNGIKQFVGGTGGKPSGNRTDPQTEPTAEVYRDNIYGVLELKVYNNYYTWQFLPIPGYSLYDAGTETCQEGFVPPPFHPFVFLPLIKR